MTTNRLLSGVLCLAACGGEPPAPPPVVRAAAVDTLIAPVVHISDAIVRSDGSWVLLGIEEGAVLVVDFEADTVLPHPGITAEEVPGANALMSAGDTLLVSDWGLRRVTSWLPDGRRVDAVPIPATARGAAPRARDAAGQWYFELAPSPGSNGQGLRDSSALVRADPLLTTFDTVAHLSPPDIVEVFREGSPPRLEPAALGGRDKWGVLNDGTIWIASFIRNQVRWLPADGSEVIMSPLLPDPVLVVSQMDREIFVRRFPEELQAEARTTRFAAVKPPFERAFAGTGRSAWLFKTAPALDSIRTLHWADSTGLVMVVEVPSYGTALGVSSEHILMGEDFPGGIRLIRFELPAR